MTATRDSDRRIRAFLDEGMTEFPERSLDAVRAAIERTHQRTVLGPWRNPPMPAFLRPAAMAAVFLGVAVVGVLLLNRPGLPPGGSPEPSVPRSAAPQPTVGVSPSVYLGYSWPAELAAGTYSTPFTWELDFEVVFTVPDGWSGRDIEVVRDPNLNVAFARVGNTSADPCARTLADPPTGPSVEDLAAALEAMPGLDASAPRPITLAGYSGLAIDASVAADAGCSPADFQLWVDPDGSHLPVTPFGPPLFTAEQRNMTISILDVDGTRLVVSQLWADAATAADRQELQAVVDSIAFGPPTRTMSVGACTLTVDLHGAGASGPPYAVILGATPPGSLNGPMPDPFPISAPVAWLDWWAPDWPGLGRDAIGGAALLPPPGASTGGFTTHTEVGGPQGSMVFDAPGTWWVRITSGRQDAAPNCLRQFPVEVLPMPAG